MAPVNKIMLSSMKVTDSGANGVFGWDAGAQVPSYYRGGTYVTLSSGNTIDLNFTPIQNTGGTTAIGQVALWSDTVGASLSHTTATGVATLASGVLGSTAYGPSGAGNQVFMMNNAGTGTTFNSAAITHIGTTAIVTTTAGTTSWNIPPAGSGNTGVVTTGTQTLAGAKTLSSTPTFSSLTTNGGIFYGNGSGTLQQTGAGTSTQVLHGGTSPSYSAVSLTADVSGTLPLANGGTGASSATQTYTPTLTNVANLDASTAYSCQYLRVGNTITVSGQVDVDPTLAATSTQLGISLPVASNLANTNECAGIAFASGIAGQGAAILADATNDRAQMQWVSGDITNQAMYFTFTYRVI